MKLFWKLFCSMVSVSILACAVGGFVLIDGQFRAALEQEGWVCWRETLSLAPSGTVGPNTFANSVLDRLGDRRRTVYLTLEGGTDTARVLSTLLRRLGDSRYSIAVPMETRL